MINASINIAWSLAEAEAAAGGHAEILPAHFWMGTCKGCDLDMDVFLRKAREDVIAAKGEITEDFREVADVLNGVGADPTKLRRLLRRRCAKNVAPVARPLHRSDALRSAFAAGRHFAEISGCRRAPLHVLLALAREENSIVDACLHDLEVDRQALADALGQKVLAPAAAEARSPSPQKEEARKARKARADAPDRKKSVLTRFGRDLSSLAEAGKLTPLIGRKKEMLAIGRALLQSRKSNVILVGEPGVGKTGIVEGLAQRLADGDMPKGLGPLRIIELSLSLLVAGTKYRGEFEERLEAIVKEAAADPNIVLFLDEIHTLMSAGRAGGSMDAANILKPALARGEIRVIGATTVAEYRRHIEKDAALERRFQKIVIEEPDSGEALEILKGLRKHLEQHHGIKIKKEAIEAAVEWSVRYLPDFRLPDKAIDLLDNACAQARFATFSQAVEPQAVGRDLIAQVVAQKCGVPVGRLTTDEAHRLSNMEEALRESVKGQDDAIRIVSEAVRTARAGLKKPNRPVGVFLFVGPSGTGKTELAKSLAEFLFDSDRGLIRFDMSEFMEEHSVSKLIGSPPGYKGSDEEGQLTKKIRTTPYSVVLFDEIEKAHPRVLDLFLQIFDEGTLTDSTGRKCSFRDAIIVMTSNLGAGAAKNREVGFGADRETPEASADDRMKHIQGAVKKHLRPELINRLTAIVQFNELSRDDLREIVAKLVRQMNTQLESKEVRVVLDDSAVDLVLDQGYSPEYGARELERAIDTLIAKPLARHLLSSKPPEKVVLKFEASGSKMKFGVETPDEKAKRK